LADRASAAYCNGYRSCCTTNGFAFNQAECDRLVRAGMSAKGVCQGVYDPVAAGECYQDIETAFAACKRTIPARAPGAACDRICTGTLPPGAACASNADCALSTEGEVWCQSSATSGGVCTLYRRGKAGDPCGDQTCTESSGPLLCTGTMTSRPTTRCFTNDGLFCPSTGGTCQPIVPIGGPCSDRNACSTAAYCDAATGKCVAKAVGGTCASWDQCPEGAYCGAGTCQAKKAAGAACTLLDECQDVCNTATGICERQPAADTLGVSAVICNGAINF
jgi:hypothetical protein